MTRTAIRCARLMFWLCFIPGWSACRSPEPEETLGSASPSPPDLSSSTDTDLVVVDPSIVAEGRIVVEPVHLSSIPRIIEVTGRIGVNENRTVRIGSIVEGRITRVLANVGDRVREGARLAFLHSPDVHETRALYAQAVADLARHQAELEYARSARDRTRRLFELKAGSLQEVQRAEADYNHAEKAITIAQAEIGRLVERLRHLGLTPEGASEEYGQPRQPHPGQFEENELIPIVSPLSGTVLERYITAGAVVSPATDLFVVSDLTTLWVYADVPESYLGYLEKGQPVALNVRAYPQEDFPASIIQVGDVLNPETRTVRVLCQTRNAERRLKAEMYAVVRFALPTQGETLVAPALAVQNLDTHTVVFLQEKPHQFRVRTVSTGRRVDSLIEILSGLTAGDRVATEGSFLLKSELLENQLTQE